MDDLNNSAGNSMYMTAMNENNEHFAREIANQILDDFLSLQEKREIDSKDQPACDVIENISDPKYVESSVNDVDIERGKIHNSSGSEVSDRPLSYCALISSEIHSFAELTRETSVKIDVKKASLISDG